MNVRWHVCIYRLFGNAFVIQQSKDLSFMAVPLPRQYVISAKKGERMTEWIRLEVKSNTPELRSEKPFEWRSLYFELLGWGIPYKRVVLRWPRQFQQQWRSRGVLPTGVVVDLVYAAKATQRRKFTLNFYSTDECGDLCLETWFTLRMIHG